MGRFNARIQHGLGAAALALIALVGVMIWLTIRASDNLEGAIGASCGSWSSLPTALPPVS